MHLAFVDARVLRDGKDAPGRAEVLLGAVHEHQRELERDFLPPGDGLNFRLTYNLVKVFLMAQVIAELRQK
ncbi:MAG: hypothetical protein Kow0069_02490 [Promethearchaeota archaeon]